MIWQKSWMVSSMNSRVWMQIWVQRRKIKNKIMLKQISMICVDHVQLKMTCLINLRPKERPPSSPTSQTATSKKPKRLSRDHRYRIAKTASRRSKPSYKLKLARGTKAYCWHNSCRWDPKWRWLRPKHKLTPNHWKASSLLKLRQKLLRLTRSAFKLRMQSWEMAQCRQIQR